MAGKKENCKHLQANSSIRKQIAGPSPRSVKEIANLFIVNFKEVFTTNDD